MKDLFLYIYYRIVRFYQYWSDWNALGTGMMFFLLILSFYLSSFVVIFLSCKGMDPPIELLGILAAASAFIGSFFSTEKLYSRLDNKYRNEPNKKLKGWLVFAFVIGGFLSFFISLFL